MANDGSATANAGSTHRLGSLDSLRGAAILAVLCSHLVGALGLGQRVDTAAVGLGRGGVTLFFLLSGYLIFRNVEVQPIGTFLCRRFFKVVPAYWLNILLILAADLSFRDFAHFPARSYLACMFVASDLLGIDAVSGVFWTLLIEIKFYLFIALQYALLGRRHMHAVMAGLVGLNLLAWGVRGHGSLTLAYFPVFYLGIEISMAETAGWSRQALLRLAAVSALLAGSLTLCLDQYNLTSAAYLVASALAFVLVLRTGLSSRLASFMGITSYSNYLYHSVVAGSVFALMGGQDGSVPAFALPVAFVAATLVAALLYRLVEVPMVGLGRRLTTRPVIDCAEASVAWSSSAGGSENA